MIYTAADYAAAAIFSFCEKHGSLTAMKGLAESIKLLTTTYFGALYKRRNFFSLLYSTVLALRTTIYSTALKKHPHNLVDLTS